VKAIEEEYCSGDRLMDETIQNIILNTGRDSSDE
jgi:hypothetical protein